MVPGDIKGMKIRPAHAIIATLVTELGGTNVQASAPEVRDVIEKGVADAVTFPWGSIPLFGIDKVTKYHMNVPLYVTSFAWVMNKAKYEAMSDAQKKVIDNHCSNEWALRVASPWADFERAGVAKLQADTASGREVYTISDAQLAEWKKAAEPVVKAWADGVMAGTAADAGVVIQAFYNALEAQPIEDALQDALYRQQGERRGSDPIDSPRSPKNRQPEASQPQRQIIVHETHAERIAVGQHGDAGREKPRWPIGDRLNEREHTPEKN